jgi:ATP/maltotriose-dependent transcriptional regulator MalT
MSEHEPEQLCSSSAETGTARPKGARPRRVPTSPAFRHGPLLLVNADQRTGERLEQLASELEDRGHCVTLVWDGVRTDLRANDGPDGAAGRPGAHSLSDLPAFIEPLTHQERATLALLPTLMSNEEIAAALHVSINTVKCHLKAVYRKLGVERRRDAVVRARDLGVLV